jgi:hypothetical protein
MCTRQRILAAACSTLCGLVLTACGSLTGTPCSGLEYDEHGPAREKYLPCADAMLEAMSRLDRGLEKTAAGDDQGRAETLRVWSELRSLMKQAGGMNRLRGPWTDNQLSAMNEGICGAYEVYAIEIFALGHPVKRLRGEVSRHNVELARRQADEARMYYRSVK